MNCSVCQCRVSKRLSRDGMCFMCFAEDEAKRHREVAMLKPPKKNNQAPLREARHPQQRSKRKLESLAEMMGDV